MGGTSEQYWTLKVTERWILQSEYLWTGISTNETMLPIEQLLQGFLFTRTQKIVDIPHETQSCTKSPITENQ